MELRIRSAVNKLLYSKFKGVPQEHEITSLEVVEVNAGSPAEKAGLKVGDKVLAIEDCKIPGCDTSDAKEFMEKSPGDELRVTVKTQGGEEKEIVIIVGAAKE